HSSRAPAASMASTAALTTSGPMPSPGIRVTGMAIAGAFLTLRGRGSNPQRDEQQEDLHSEKAGGDGMQPAELRQLRLSGRAERMDARRDERRGEERAHAREQRGVAATRAEGNPVRARTIAESAAS